MKRILLSALLISGTAAAQTTPAPQPIQLADLDPTLAEIYRMIADENWPGAIRSMENELAKNPKNDDFRIMIATGMNRTGHQDDAIKILQEVLQRKPETIAALTALGETYSYKGQQDKAAEPFRKVIQLRPDFPQVLSMNALTALHSGHPELAELIGELMIRERPNDPTIAITLASILVELDKDLERALDLAKLAVNVRPSVQSLDTLGLIYLKLGRIDEALPNLLKALSGQIKSSSLQNHVLKALDAVARPTPDQRTLRNLLRADVDTERDVRLKELVVRLSN